MHSAALDFTNTNNYSYLRPYRLAILIPNVWGIRNIVHSGVLQSLSGAGIEIHLLMRRVNQSIAVQPEYTCAKKIHPMLALKEMPVAPGKAFLDAVIYSAFMQGNKIQSYPIYSKWYRRNDPGFRSGLTHFLGALTQFYPIYKALYDLSEINYTMKMDIEPVRKQLLEISPDLLLSTSFITNNEYAYVIAAKQLKIPTLASVLSFDNLTSRASYLFRFDHYMVWSEWMKQQLVKYYRISAEQISVTGTPQFDFHRRKEYCWDRQSTLAFLGLSPNDKYFVYGASSRLLTPDEPLLVRQLIQKISQEKELASYKIVVRLHPLDDWQRWDGQIGEYKNATLSGSWSVRPDSGGWAFITSDEQNKLVSLLTHAEGCINIASTLGLDAATLDRPVIGVDFRGDPSAPQDILYEEYYTEHYLPLVERGAMMIAKNWEHLLSLIREAVRSPEKHKSERQDAVREICGTVDGHAADRLVSDVLDQLSKVKRQ